MEGLFEQIDRKSIVDDPANISVEEFPSKEGSGQVRTLSESDGWITRRPVQRQIFPTECKL